VNSAEREPSTQVAASPTWRKIESEVASAPLLRESLVVADLEDAQRQLKQELHGAENATALAQQRIGSAVIAHNQVDELAGASAARISVGDNVFSNETVRTAADSNGKFVFSDDTNLAMGPQSTVKLDRFVFSGEATYSKAALNLSEGAFRFITGISQKRAYDITTPTAVIGVRGTIVDIKVTKGLTTVALLEGRALVCPRGDQHDCTTLKPGQTAAVTLKKAALAHTSWTFASSCVGNSALCGQTTVAEAQTTGAQRVALGSPGAGTPCAP
jgi:ferric-dicitrate binding protein FerR (iron transport regulator)